MGMCDYPAGIPTVTGTNGVVVNPANPMQLLVNRRDHSMRARIKAIRWGDITPPSMTGNVTAMAYGMDNPSAAYVGTSTGQLFLRTSGSGVPLPVTSYPGGAKVDAIAVDRSDWEKAAIISDNGNLYYTTDHGANWTNIRGNAGNVLRFMRTIRVPGSARTK